MQIAEGALEVAAFVKPLAALSVQKQLDGAGDGPHGKGLIAPAADSILQGWRLTGRGAAHNATSTERFGAFGEDCQDSRQTDVRAGDDTGPSQTGSADPQFVDSGGFPRTGARRHDGKTR